MINNRTLITTVSWGHFRPSQPARRVTKVGPNQTRHTGAKSDCHGQPSHEPFWYGSVALGPSEVDTTTGTGSAVEEVQPAIRALLRELRLPTTVIAEPVGWTMTVLTGRVRELQLVYPLPDPGGRRPIWLERLPRTKKPLVP